jgi:hypothetical protein
MNSTEIVIDTGWRGRVVLVIEGVVSSVLENSPLYEGVIESLDSEVGDIYSEGVFAKPLIPLIKVPQSISPAQMRIALIDSNLFDSVISAVASGDQKLKIWWEFSTAFDRDNEQVLAMAATLGVTDRELDDLWTLGALL